MAEATRMKDLVADLKQVTDIVSKHDAQHRTTQQQLIRIEDTQASFQHTLDTITRSVDCLTTNTLTGALSQ